MSGKNFDLDLFLFKLLGKRKRRKFIIAQWHASNPEDVPQDHVYKFLDYILHKDIRISLYPEHFYIFADQSFGIQYNWLCKEEREFIWKLYENRDEIFEIRSFSAANPKTFMLAECRVTPTFTIYNRREVVRDFCWMGLTRKDIRETFSLVLNTALQRLQVQKNGAADSFVRQIQYALQGGKPINELICVY